MELKAGYKQTETGVIPEDWNLDYIGNLAEVSTGSKNTQDRTHDGEYPFFVRSQTVERINSYSFDGEAVLTAGDGVGTGKVFHYIYGKFDVHQRVYRISNFHTRLNGYFFYLYFSENFYNRIMQMTAKSSVDSVRREMITRMLIPFPSATNEQIAIVNALRDMDALLDSLDRLIAKKRDLKQATMQQLLTGKTRLPGFSGEWEIVSAGNIGSFKGGNGFPTSFQGVTSGEYPFFKVSDMNKEGNETFMKTANNYINEPIRNQICVISFPTNSIVFAKVGAAVFLERKKILAQASCLDNNMAAYIPNPTRADTRFIHFVLLNTKLSNLVSTTALPSLSGSMLNAIKFALPSLEEQTAIASILSDVDAEITVLEQRRNKTRDLKQAMMQELLTGKTRLMPRRGSHA